MQLLVVIVNYRTADLTIDCLKSLEDEINSISGAEVSVVENASGDNSYDVLSSAIVDNDWGRWVKLHHPQNNLGFAGGNNFAIRPALESDSPPDYVLLLNPDTKILPGAITTLLEFMEQNPDVGIAGSRLQYPDGTSQVSAFRFPSILGEFESMARTGPITKLLKRWKTAPPCKNMSHSTDWVAGASMIVRTAVFENIGLLDEMYFMYYEEVDFCFRAKNRNWKVFYYPDSKVIHYIGQASGVTGSQKKIKPMPTYWFESRRRYFVKNNGIYYYVFTNIFWILGYSISKMRNIFNNRDYNYPPNFFFDFCKNSLMKIKINND